MNINEIFLFLILQFIFFVSIHIFLNKIKFIGSQNPIFVFIFSVINFVILYSIFIGQSFDEVFFKFLIFNLTLVMLYFHLFIGILKSVSIRIIYEVFISKNKYVTFQKLNTIYSYNDLINKRLDLLLKNKWILNEENNFICSKKGKLLVKINMFLLKIYKLKNSG